jgi:hypothetical protein
MINRYLHHVSISDLPIHTIPAMRRTSANKFRRCMHLCDLVIFWDDGRMPPRPDRMNDQPNMESV